MEDKLLVSVNVEDIVSEYDIVSMDRENITGWTSIEKCPACMVQDIAELSSIRNSDGETFLEVGVCNNCAHIFFKKMPGHDYFLEYYKNQFSTKKLVQTSPPEQSYSQVLSVAEPYISKDFRILDVGCGYGSAIQYFKKQGYENTVGLEPSSLRAEVGKSAGFEIFNMPIEDISRENQGEFDFVYSWHAFEHIYDIDLAILSLKKVIRPGGYILIAVPHYQAEHLFNITHFLPHIHSFNENSIKALLLRHGFEIIHTDDSLRILARNAENEPHSTVDARKTLADLNLKVQRDFNIRARTIDNKSAGVLKISRYRGSEEILEPSFGHLNILTTRKSGLKTTILRFFIFTRSFRTNFIERIIISMFGRYVAGLFSVARKPGTLPKVIFEYPSRQVNILMK